MVEIYHGEDNVSDGQVIRRSCGNSGLSDNHSVLIVGFSVVGHVEASGSDSVREVGIRDVGNGLEALVVVGAVNGPIGGIKCFV